MSALKLKPLEDSNLYKRRTTSKENLLQTGTASAGGMGDIGGGGRPNEANYSPTSTTGAAYAMQTKPSGISSTERQHHHHQLQQTVLPPPMQPMHVSYPQRPQAGQLVEGYYQQPRSPIRATPISLTVQQGTTYTNTNISSGAGNKYPYDSNSTPIHHQQRNLTTTPSGRVLQPQYQNVVSGVTERNESGFPIQQSTGGYQNLPNNRGLTTLPPLPSNTPTPVTPGRKMESWEQFGRSNVQMVSGLVDGETPPCFYS